MTDEASGVSCSAVQGVKRDIEKCEGNEAKFGTLWKHFIKNPTITNVDNFNKDVRRCLSFF